ncbi:Hypothetical protein NTJ_10665 [Nesidiocoris tenuis]|uniref:CCHC-type domain-containing protein n=1 Tax=Nesidiocoris tenuis TaxID=355587 RepID=A0ABN7B0A3_9HEMI|nr:Hypothetical protein NTJ_10665 [Nesidiocoris tenuis]
MDAEEIRKQIAEEISKRENAIKLKMEEEYARKFEAIRGEILQVVEESTKKIAALASKAISLASGSMETRDTAQPEADEDEPTEIVHSFINPPIQVKGGALKTKFAQVSFSPETQTMNDFQNRFASLVNDIRIHRGQGVVLPEQSIPQVLHNPVPDASPRFAEETRQQNSALERKRILDQLLEMVNELKQAEQTGQEASASFRAPTPFKRKAPVSFGKGPGGKKIDPLMCYKCGIRGHAKVNCPRSAKKCYNCHKYGHISNDCDSPPTIQTLNAKAGYSGGV